MGDSAAELQQLVDVLPQYEDQIRYWESQLEAISNVRADIRQAQETLNGMLDSDKEMEMMVPVGHNTSIFTTVKSDICIVNHCYIITIYHCYIIVTNHHIVSIC